MFWDSEKIITVYEIPESVEGDPYIRTPKTEDKDPKTIRLDRETGKEITLWEEKLRKKGALFNKKEDKND